MSRKQVLQAALAAALSLTMMATPVFANPVTATAAVIMVIAVTMGITVTTAIAVKTTLIRATRVIKKETRGREKITANPIMSLPISASPERVRWR